MTTVRRLSLMGGEGDVVEVYLLSWAGRELLDVVAANVLEGEGK